MQQFNNIEIYQSNNLKYYKFAIHKMLVKW